MKRPDALILPLGFALCLVSLPIRSSIAPAHDGDGQASPACEGGDCGENVYESEAVDPCDQDGDGHLSLGCGGDDCDDFDGNRYPGNPEVCDTAGHDEDCDPQTFGERDTDGDGYFDIACCNVGNSVTYCGNDCDDQRAGVHPHVPEPCDGLDNDCDEAVDEGVMIPSFTDGDGDGWGVGSASQSCPAEILTAQRAARVGDCNDGAAQIHPGIPEICNGIDDDCDGAIDEGGLQITSYPDADGDGWGDAGDPGQGMCAEQILLQQRSTRAGDCNDGEARIHPQMPESCNGIDDDCDGLIDEGLGGLCSG